jgi:apolipoprotein N-acyltransferase
MVQGLAQRKGHSGWHRKLKTSFQTGSWSALAGGLLALSVSAPWSGEPIWWLGVISLLLLARQIHKAHSWKKAAWSAWCFATVWLAGSFWWLYIAMHTYGGMPSALAALAVFALAAALALIYAGFCAAYHWLTPSNTAFRALSFAVIWTLAELARGNWFTGFGWGAVAYTQTNGPLGGYAPWVGAYGLGAVAAWLAMSLVNLGRSSQRQRAAILLVVLLPVGIRWLEPNWTQSSGHLQVALLQGNIPQNEKFESGAGIPLALNWYSQELKNNRTSLVVTPETAIPLLAKDLPDNYLNGISQRYASGEQAALIGIPMGGYREGYTNSVLGFKPGQAETWRYDKHHLVPFGEFIPPLFKWFVRLMNIPLGDFNRGGLEQSSFEWQGQRLAPNICYEDLFGEEIGARFSAAEKAPTILVNSSNIAWFGDTLAIDQHLNISRMRALEFERPMIRATNTGATVIIDYKGQVTHSLPRHTQGVLRGDVEGRNGITPYAWWVSRFGLWPLWALGFLLVARLWQMKRRGRT